MAMKHGGRGPGHMSRWTAAVSPIPYLFANGEQGAWFDFTDTSTWYQDAARTTPAATLGDVVGLVLDKSRGLALGPELVTNGDFASGTGWTTGSGWSIGGGVATHASGTANADLSSAIGLVVVGGLYKVTIDITWTSGAEIRVIFGNVAKGFTASGSYTFYHTPTTTGDGSIRIRAVVGDEIASVDNISVKLLAGNHASQATTAQKPLRARIPLGGRRNMLTYTEDFSNAAWAKSEVTASGFNIIPTAVSAPHRLSYIVTTTSGTTYTAWCVVKANGYSKIGIREGNFTGAYASFDLNAGTKLDQGVGGTGQITSLGGGDYLITMTSAAGGITARFDILILPNSYTTGAPTAPWTGDGTSSITVSKTQFELGSSPTSYQKVVADWDVTESGVTSIPALYYDGSDDSLATAAIGFTGTDKMTVFAGVEKLSDAAIGMLLELSVDTSANNGTFNLVSSYNGSTTGAFWGTQGKGPTNFISVYSAGSYAAPDTSVLTLVKNVSGPSTSLRRNGSEIASTAANQGGNFGNYPLYIGRRAGSSIPFKGYMIGHMVIVGKLANASEIAAVEATERAATGAY